MNKPIFLFASKIQKKFDVSSATLRRWSEEGRVHTTRLPGGKRLYSIADIESIFKVTFNQSEKKKICSARVSSEHQRGDLERQIQDLQFKFPDHEIISDVGSGLNYKRKNFQILLDRVYDGPIQEVVVLHKDRLCRYGFELVEFIF
jgi:predicted site-specific integrase-resolvase